VTEYGAFTLNKDVIASCQ